MQKSLCYFFFNQNIWRVDEELRRKDSNLWHVSCGFNCHLCLCKVAILQHILKDICWQHIDHLWVNEFVHIFYFGIIFVKKNVSSLLKIIKCGLRFFSKRVPVMTQNIGKGSSIKSDVLGWTRTLPPQLSGCPKCSNLVPQIAPCRLEGQTRCHSNQDPPGLWKAMTMMAGDAWPLSAFPLSS